MPDADPAQPPWLAHVYAAASATAGALRATLAGSALRAGAQWAAHITGAWPQ